MGLVAHHVTASVSDVDRAVRWYTTVLGFAVRERGVRQNGAFEFAELSIPGFGVALVHIRSSAAAAPAPTAPQPAAGWMHVVFSVTDADAAYRALKDKGADVWLRPQAPPGPVTTFLLHDSEGNEIEIVGRAAAAKP